MEAVGRGATERGAAPEAHYPHPKTRVCSMRCAIPAVSPLPTQKHTMHMLLSLYPCCPPRGTQWGTQLSTPIQKRRSSPVLPQVPLPHRRPERPLCQAVPGDSLEIPSLDSPIPAAGILPRWPRSAGGARTASRPPLTPRWTAAVPAPCSTAGCTTLGSGREPSFPCPLLSRMWLQAPALWLGSGAPRAAACLPRSVSTCWPAAHSVLQRAGARAPGACKPCKVRPLCLGGRLLAIHMLKAC